MKKTAKARGRTGTRKGSPTSVQAEVPRRPQAAPGMDARDQVQLYEKAMKLFHARDFQKAQALYKQAAGGPSRDVAHSARAHLRICEQRLAGPELRLETAEDHYNYAISLINRRQLGAAEEHLRQALRDSPGGDHIHYALSLARGLGGDMQGAAEHMRRAIELHPRNRSLARSDPDFAEISQRSPLREILYP